MANRYIPFGYEIQNARIVINEDEAMLARAAFELYIAGKSYKAIAERFELSGIRYNKDSAKWNKNMVKRIIENEKYTGKSGYPQIIDEKTYFKANKLRLSKTTQTDEEKTEYDKFIRQHSECPECGFALKRQHQGHGDKVWTAYKCTNPVCSARSVRENTVYEILGEIIRVLTDDISLAEPEARNYPRSDDAIDELTNSIILKTASGECEKDEILEDIYTLAKIKFRSLKKADMTGVTERIKQELCKYGVSEKAPLPLMEKILSRLYIGGEKRVTIRLINGKILERM